MPSGYRIGCCLRRRRRSEQLRTRLEAPLRLLRSNRRNMLSGNFEFRVARMNAAQPLFDFDFLRARIVHQPLNALLLSLDIAGHVSVLLFKRPDLMTLLAEGTQSLGSAKHDGGVSGEPGERCQRSDGPEDRAWH